MGPQDECGSPEGCGARRFWVRRVGGPTLRVFFFVPLLPHSSVFLLFTLWIFSWNCLPRIKALDHAMCAFWVSSGVILFESQRAQRPPGVHKRTPGSPNVHREGPQRPPTPRENPQREHQSDIFVWRAQTREVFWTVPGWAVPGRAFVIRNL